MMVNRRKIILTGLAGAGLSLADKAFLIPVSKAAARAQAVSEKQAKPNWFFLTEPEAAFLTLAVDILIPEDEFPSASQAGVVDYIDMQLATKWGAGDGLYLEPPFDSGVPEQGYQLGLTPAMLYREAIAALQSELPAGGLADLPAPEREDFMRRLSEGEVSSGAIPSNVFFEHLHQNTIEGYFADPMYHGNLEMAGWKMIGFPGAHAYYLTEVDRYNMQYDRAPAGVAHRMGSGTPLRTTADYVQQQRSK